MSEENVRKGGISVETQHIFPIIKKWLYSDKDIFLREIVSNASDAITKYKRLISLAKAEEPETPFRIDVTTDKENGILTVSDNGIGMTVEELEKYICSIALSGALDFIQKYEGDDDSAKSGIIGHFGLGFYSSFMVSDKVEIITKSYIGAPALRWVCEDSGSYEITPSERDTCGTDIVMHINDDEKEYLEKDKILETLNKYCSFMPIEIYYSDVNDNTTEEKKEEESKPVNETQPLWLKQASECTPEEYKEFYHKAFNDVRDPLFWIHLNADYPLNFKGILYFPRINNEYESAEGQVKLYYNQVYVANNIKEVIPDYLLMLKGVLDCPELPLNVSRSYLQNNSYVAKLSAHIVKKVADKLNAMLNTEREEYEKTWEEIRTFIEYACLRERKFYDRVKDSLLLRLTDGKYVTLPEYLKSAEEKNKNKVYYTTDRTLQAQYVSLLEGEGISVAVMEHMIDTQFATLLESCNEGVSFLRVDADVADALKGEDCAIDTEKLTELFKKASADDKLKITFQSLKNEKIPVLLNVSEESRRMEQMMKLYAISGKENEFAYPLEMTLTVNTSSKLINALSSMTDGDKALRIASYMYKLSLLTQKKLSPEEMQSFMSDSFGILDLL